MRSTVILEKAMLDELMAETRAKNKAAAVRKAIAFYIKHRRMERIRSLKGKLEFDVAAREMSNHER